MLLLDTLIRGTVLCVMKQMSIDHCLRNMVKRKQAQISKCNFPYKVGDSWTGTTMSNKFCCLEHASLAGLVILEQNKKNPETLLSEEFCNFVNA
jgi:hypothetical protein